VSRGSVVLTSAGVLYSAGPCGLYLHVGYDPRGSMFSDLSRVCCFSLPHLRISHADGTTAKIETPRKTLGKKH